MVTFNHFCDIGNGTFTAWKGNDFGPCFELLVLVCPANALLALSSAFFGGLNHYGNLRDSPLSSATKFRLAASFLVCLEALIEIACSLLLKTSHAPVYFLTCAVIAFAWLLNTYTLWNMRYLFMVSRASVPRIHLLAVVVASLTSALQLFSIIVTLSDNEWKGDKLGVKEYGAIVRLFLQVVFLLSLIRWHTGENQTYGYGNVPPSASMSVQAPEYPDEHSALLRSISQGTFYSSIHCVIDNLGIAEANSNFLSKLSFWWVGPMMLKGSKGQIQDPDDLFSLPPSLSTANLKNIFSRVFYCQDTQPGPEVNDTTSYLSDSHSDYDVQFSPDSNKHKNLSLPPLVSTTQRTLLGSLHHAFGCQYYCIGILRLLADALGFAGPLLLHALVSFMENSKVCGD